jgi:FdhE protein
MLDLRAAEIMVPALIVRLASSGLKGSLEDQIRALRDEFREDPAAPHGVMSRLFDEHGESCLPPLLRFVVWTVLSVYLQPISELFSRWRNEEHWLHRYCPMCGSLPAMAQLVAADQGRRRLLSCRCGTRWLYKRTGCPFCEQADDHHIAVMEIEGEGELRIEYCTSCRSYLKTYNGQGNESLLLADWTSIHLDVAAQGRGLKRLAASLYTL